MAPALVLVPRTMPRWACSHTLLVCLWVARAVTLCSSGTMQCCMPLQPMRCCPLGGPSTHVVVESVAPWASSLAACCQGTNKPGLVVLLVGPPQGWEHSFAPNSIDLVTPKTHLTMCSFGGVAPQPSKLPKTTTKKAHH